MTPQLWGLHQADRLECGPSGNTVRDARYCIVVPLFTMLVKKTQQETLFLRCLKKISY